MSDDDNDRPRRPHIVDMLFGPATPEEQRAAHLDHPRARQESERMVRDALPIVQDIRKKLRELTALGFGDGAGRVSRARHDMATLAEDLQNHLHHPPPPDPPEAKS